MCVIFVSISPIDCLNCQTVREFERSIFRQGFSYISLIGAKLLKIFSGGCARFEGKF